MKPIKLPEPENWQMVPGIYRMPPYPRWLTHRAEKRDKEEHKRMIKELEELC